MAAVFLILMYELSGGAASGEPSEENTSMIDDERFEISYEQIYTLRDKALAHGDVAMAVICEISLDDETIGDDLYGTIDEDKQLELEELSQFQALELACEAIRNADAQQTD